MATLLELLVPYRRRELRSELSGSEAARALAGEVEPARWFRLGSSSRQFQGTVGDLSFDIRRINRYRNSFLPRIRGEIRDDQRGCRVSITMSLSAPVLMFIAVWLALAISSAFASLGGSSGLPGARSPVLVSAGLCAFVWLMTIGGFGFEAAKAERLLARIFDASRWVQRSRSE